MYLGEVGEQSGGDRPTAIFSGTAAPLPLSQEISGPVSLEMSLMGGFLRA